ncbi:MAG: ankyrin repeat domain-containing protein [Planctomycetes bacterium]|nr:ankyrin repeat domain-containing protein [Planctomycetota bacterium]
MKSVSGAAWLQIFVARFIGVGVGFFVGLTLAAGPCDSPHERAKDSAPEVVALLEDGAKAPEKPTVDAAQLALNRELMKAASSGKVPQVRELLKKGADLEWRDPGDNGKTALTKAVVLDRFAVVKVLIEHGADVNYPDGSGRYPVYFCVITRNIEMLNYLLERGGKKDVNRGPAPMLVSLCDHGQGAAEMIPILIKAGADPNAFKGPVTPLIAAIQLDPKVRKPEIARSYVKALLANQANVNLKDKKGKSPLAWARQRGDQEIIEMLIQAGAQDDESESEPESKSTR